MEYFNSLRLALLEIVERKLSDFKFITSKNYHYFDKTLRELELLLSINAEQRNFEKCAEIKAEIQKKVRKQN